ncbi:MAG: type-F conjugative transfer system secretin TraK [Chlamydiales bacterium]
MKSFYGVLFVLGFLTSSIEAAQYLDMDTTNILKCTVSSRHHNRIVVDGKRIKKVIYPDGDISIRVEEESGQIFVQPMIDIPQCTTVSIVTSEGVVQDLELNFEDLTSEILILRGIECFPCEIEELEVCSEGSELDSIQAVVNSILSGYVPVEYTSVDTQEIDCTIGRGVTLKSISKLVGWSYTIYILGIENFSSRCKVLNECEINIPQGEWVFIENRNLNRGEKTIALIGVKNS